MFHFWNSVIEPAFHILEPREILEIGADHGHNTRNILNYCRKTNAYAHIIDPLPKFDPENFKIEFGNVFKFYRSLSLNALPLIAHMDAALIDGDHNWYTVYHELKLIEKKCIEAQQTFPLILVHDIGWPYARRDMYYDPDNIPEAYRMPYAQKGLNPDTNELTDEGGLNPHLHNAIYAHNLRNGVLTAIEDFIRESDLSLSLLKIPVFNGLGMIYPLVFVEEYPRFSDFVQDLSTPEIISDLLKEVENIRIKTVIAHEESNQKLRDSESARRRETKEKIAEIHNLEQTISTQSHQLQDLEAKRRKEAENYRAEIDELKSRKIATETLKNELTSRLQERDRQFESLRQEKNAINMQKDQFSVYIRQLKFQYNALMQSNRWKVGNALISTLTLSKFKKHFVMSTDHMDRIFKEFDAIAAASKNIGPIHIPHQRMPAALPKKRRNLTVAVIAWDVGHNPLGRAYLLAEAIISRYFHVVLLGPSFPRYNHQVWEPLKNGQLEILPLPGQNFPEFAHILEKAARRIEADIIIACKPRLPSVQLGLMMKAFKNRPLFIDIDDYELSFFRQKSALSLEDIKNKGKFTDLDIPFEETWTRFAESLIGFADGIFVSNLALQKKFGGVIVPHARDELRFDPSLYDRNKRRRELGLGIDDRIVLFLGTPREHKGVTEVLSAVKACCKENYKLCLIGSPPDRGYEEKLKHLGGNSLIMLPDEPFDRLPENLMVADLVCLIQNPESEISRYQLPAKAIDALSMGIPILATPTEPLAPLIEAGAIETVKQGDLCTSIDHLLSNIESFKSKQAGNRDLFLNQYSYAAIDESLYPVLLNALARPNVLPQNALDFIDAEKSLKPGSDPDRAANRDGIDVVLFWKQNDTGLYGRRSDMFVKYLSRRQQVRKIAVFDMPISMEELREKSKGNGIVHDHMIYRETMLRNWGMRDTDKVSFHTFIYSSGTADINQQKWSWPDRSQYLEFIECRLRESGINAKKAFFWFYPQNPYIIKIADHFQPTCRVVDLVDDHRTWPGLSEIKRLHLTKHYKDVLKIADLALANCQRVQDSMQKYHPDIKLIPNGCELEPPPDITKDKVFQKFMSMKGPKLGYVGNLEKDKIDVDLIQYVAGRHPDWNILLIGSTHANPGILALDRHPNIHFIGVVKYPDVRAWIKTFDVAILPHLNSEKTQSMNPLKLYVYCSLEVPVVSTDIENLDELKSIIRIGRSRQEFESQIEQILSGKSGKDLVPIRQCLENNTWEKRIDMILQELEAIMPRNFQN